MGIDEISIEWHSSIFHLLKTKTSICYAIRLLYQLVATNTNEN